jgi:hypothetical protein
MITGRFILLNGYLNGRANKKSSRFNGSALSQHRIKKPDNQVIGVYLSSCFFLLSS